MPGSKKKDDTKILATAMDLFAQKGFSKVTLAAVAKASGSTLAEVKALYPTKEEMLIAAFRTGQKKMETRFRTILTGDLEAHVMEMFEGIKEGLMPYGSDVHLQLILQATEDRTLMEIIRRTSRNVNFAIKAYLSQMVALSIIDQVENVEKVNESMVTSFIEDMASTMEGKKLPAIKKNWVARVKGMLSPSAKTTIPTQ
ncbi:MAG: TetR/AcrR family transcriptional regulator [Methanomassiliicoccus sp.]|nr:TetR/AcrR family transcriptional regulator [Methanomassiliicoccus sp.]